MSRTPSRIALTLFLGLCLASAPPAQRESHTGVHKAEHFEIRYRPGSKAGASVDRVAALAERELARICSQLGTEPKGRFALYLYDDVEDLSTTTGTSGNAGFSAGREFHVPHDNDQTRYHEMVHVVAHNLLRPAGREKRNLFFAEGLANACLEFVHGVPVHAVAKYYRMKKALPALAELTGTADFYGWLGRHPGFNAYDAAGSYFLFLLQTYGAARTTKYYKGLAPEKALGASEKRIEKAWHAMLDRFAMRPELEKLLDERHGASAGVVSAQRAPAGLPADILGKPREWKSLMKAKLVTSDRAKWRRKGKSIVGSSDDPTWSVCELGTTEYRDCVVRATIKTPRSCPIQVRLGDGNQGMLVNGTFLYRNGQPAASSSIASMHGDRRTTDFVLVRRGGKIEIWIDGRKALTTNADDTPTPVGIAIHQGLVIFEDVRVRPLR